MKLYYIVLYSYIYWSEDALKVEVLQGVSMSEQMTILVALHIECQSSYYCTWMVCVEIFWLTQEISATSVLSSFSLRLLHNIVINTQCKCQRGTVDINLYFVNIIFTENLCYRSYFKMCGTAGAPSGREENTSF